MGNPAKPRNASTGASQNSGILGGPQGYRAITNGLWETYLGFYDFMTCALRNSPLAAASIGRAAIGECVKHLRLHEDV